jgi:hypothetical protein
LEFVLPACARISSAIGPLFEPYLTVVMTPLLAVSNQVITFTMEDADDDDVTGETYLDEDCGTETAIIAIGGGQKKKCTLNIHAVQQKNQVSY